MSMKYKVIILDKDYQEVKKKIEKNLMKARHENEKIMKSRGIRVLSKAMEKVTGVPLLLEIAWKWVSDRELEIEIYSTLNLGEKDYDRFIKGLKDWGLIKILREDGTVVA